ncbi:MAG: tRNA dihydrouridine synthase DusB [Desulfobulbaceae bacterium]|nr:tRNA dihydrouridine synthase DusB [Desulfobulbaceae bacterium]
MQLNSIFSKKPFILAPLAGYSDLPFRLLCKEMGAALCVSEMISANGLTYGQHKTIAMLASDPTERPVSMQLFGNDPNIMGEAAAIVTKQPIDMIDINMGCPVKKVIKKGSGAALMKDMERAGAIIQAVCQNSDLPVSVKFRSGWTHNAIIAPDFAQMAQDCGAAMVTIHGRTWSQGFGGLADQNVIAQVKDKVQIPVIGNGDILCHEDGIKMMQNTGCDGVMIGRGTLGNPWVFSPQDRPKSFELRRPVIMRHIQLIEKYSPPFLALFRMKSHMGRYLIGLPGASQYRKSIANATSTDTIKQLFQITS